MVIGLAIESVLLVRGLRPNNTHLDDISPRILRDLACLLKTRDMVHAVRHVADMLPILPTKTACSKMVCYREGRNSK